MLLCTYQPLGFKFDEVQEYDEVDQVRIDQAKEDYGIDLVSDYSILCGSPHKPIFCFECVRDSKAVAAKSMFLAPTRPEQFILFEADDCIAYNDIRWNSEFGDVPMKSEDRDKVLNSTEYYSTCYIVFKIPSNKVIYRCNIGEVIRTGRLLGKAHPQGQDRLYFIQNVRNEADKWWHMQSQCIKIAQKEQQLRENTAEHVDFLLCRYKANCFNLFYLPQIIRQCLELSEPMFIMNPILAMCQADDTHTVYAVLQRLSLGFSQEYIHEDEFLSVEDAVEYRTELAKDVFDLCYEMFTLPWSKISQQSMAVSATSVGIKLRQVADRYNRIMNGVHKKKGNLVEPSKEQRNE